MASGGVIVLVNPFIDIVLAPIESFQRETKVKIRAEIYNTFSKKAQVQWEIYPTSAPKEKVILPVKTVVAANGRKQLEKVFEGLNPNTEYTIVARVTNLGEISGGTVVGEYWKTARAKTLIMSRNLQAYRIGTGNVTARLMNLTKYPYDRQVKFFYKKKGEKKYKLSETVALPEGENGNIIHLYSSLQQNTTYIFYVEVYRTDKNQRISYLSMTVKTNVYIPGGIPKPYQGEILIVPGTEACKVRVMWEGVLPDDTFVIGLKGVEEREDVWVWVPIRDKNNNVYRLTTPGQWITFASQYEEDTYKLAVARYVNGEYVQLYTTDPIYVEFTFPTSGFIYRNRIEAEGVLEYANAFVCLHDFLILDETDVSGADEIYKALLEKRASIEAGSPVEGGEDCIFASMILLSNLWLGTNIAEWGNLSEEPVNLTALDNLERTIYNAFRHFIDRS